MKILSHVALAPYTTFQLGGSADFFAIAKNYEDIQAAVDFSKARKLPIFILGGGSNIVIGDKGIRGLVVKMEFKKTQWEGATLTASAGCSWDMVVAEAVRKGYSGIENLSLIPGTVGGAVYQNIGAYGAELKDVLARVQVCDQKDKKLKWLSRDQCTFGYRTSIFRQLDESKNNPLFINLPYDKFIKRGYKSRYIILAAELRLSKVFEPNIQYPDLVKYFKDKTPTLATVRQAVIKIRRAKLPYPPAIANAGSFFKNPVISLAQFKNRRALLVDIRCLQVGRGLVKVSAAGLIEAVGWKGKRLGKVGVSDKHALVLVHYRGGKAADLAALVRQIQKDVFARFSVRLEPEVQILAEIGGLK